MTTEGFYRKIEEILEVETGSIKGSEALAGFSRWDSLALLSFIAMADAELSIAVSATELQQCRTVADLARLIRSRDDV